MTSQFKSKHSDSTLFLSSSGMKDMGGYSKQEIFLFFLLLTLWLHLGNGAIIYNRSSNNRIQDIRLIHMNKNKRDVHAKTFTSTTTTLTIYSATPIPPSGPSQRHNRYRDGLALDKLPRQAPRSND